MSKEQLFCFLDVLGFSNIVKTRGLSALYSDYQELLAAADKQQHEGLAFSSWQGTPYFGMEKRQSTYFSDTIVLWCPYHPREFQSLCYAAMEIFCKSIEIGLPLRGSISVGEAILNKGKQHFVGKPIVSAAEAEKVQRWIGVTLSKEFRESPFNGSFNAACFMPWEKHLKEGALSTVTPLVLDYPRWWRKTRTASIQEAISRLNTDVAFSIYYENALEFADYSEANPQWWETHPAYKKSQENA